MMYPDYKMRYACLGQAEISSSSDNKTAVYALMDWGWLIIIQKTRGLIGLPNPEEELRLLEEKANATYGEYQAALTTTANLEGQMGDLKDEIAAMSKQLSEEQGNISVYTDRQAKALTVKGETEVE